MDEPDINGISGDDMKLSTDYTHACDDNHPVSLNLSANWFWGYQPNVTKYTSDILSKYGYPIADVLLMDWYPSSGYPRSAATDYGNGTEQAAFDLYAVAMRRVKSQTKGLIPLGVYVETGNVYGNNSDLSPSPGYGANITPEKIAMTVFMSIVEQDARLLRWYEYDSRDIGGSPWLWRNEAESNANRAKMQELTSLFTGLAMVIAQPSSPVVVTGGTTSSFVENNDRRVKGIKKSYNNKDYIFIYNRDISNSSSVNISLSKNIATLRIYNGSSVNFSGASFSDNIPASGYRIYEVTYNDSTVSCAIGNGDVNKDGRVNISDAAILMAKWGQTVTNDPADINCDGRVNIFDAAILMARWAT